MDEKDGAKRSSLQSSSFDSPGGGSQDGHPQQLLEARWRHPSPIPYRDRILRRLCIGLCMVLAAWTFASSLLPRLTTSNTPYDGGYQQNSILGDGHVSQITGANKTRHVSLEAHIMSKCPDAKACLQELVIPAMEKVSDKVDFNLSFIGRVDNHSDSVTCEHGPSECLGNLILLCAEQLYPDPKLSLGFANCMIDDYHDIPQRDLVESCAMEHGIDFKKVNDCISDEGRAQDMLRDSVERSAEAQVSTSCTIRLNGKVWCVTGEKKDCNDGANLDGLVKDVKNAYDELN